jgi:pimeloyl-ACP methyl ester carboxylesterase
MLSDLSKYEKFETVTQGKVRYYEAGEGENVLLLHGMGVYTSADTFQFQFEALAKKYHVIALDFLGFGKSDRTLEHGPTFDVIVDGVREFIDMKGIESTHLVGHSAGCWFGGILAYESPDRINKIIFLGAAGMNVKPVHGVASYQEPTLESLTEGNMTSVYEGSSFTADMAGEVAAQMLPYVKMTGAFEGLKPLVAQMANPDSRKSYLLQRRLPYIKNPTLMIWGESEFMEPHPTWTAEWEESGHNPGKGSKPWVTQNNQFEIIKGATHNVHWEQPERITTMIEEFLG